MRIRANGRDIEALAITEGRAIIQGEERPTLAIAMPGAVCAEDVEALADGVINIDEGYKVYTGYTGLVDVEVLLYKPTGADLSFEQAASFEQRVIEAENKLREKEEELSRMQASLSELQEKKERQHG